MLLGKIFKGVFGDLYRVTNSVVMVSQDGINWEVSRYGRDIDFFKDGIGRGYLKELTKDEHI